jgi:hypothetical protein
METVLLSFWAHLYFSLSYNHVCVRACVPPPVSPPVFLYCSVFFSFLFCFCLKLISERMNGVCQIARLDQDGDGLFLFFATSLVSSLKLEESRVDGILIYCLHVREEG